MSYTHNKYRAFVAKTGFSDYEDADAMDTLYNYGFEDTVPGYTALRVDWSELLRRVGKALEGSIRLGVTVGRLRRLRCIGPGVTIVATDIDGARRVTGKKLPGVATQPFARVYFSCDEDLACGYTVCAPFQKITQMGRGKGSESVEASLRSLDRNFAGLSGRPSSHYHFGKGNGKGKRKTTGTRSTPTSPR